MEKLGFLNKLSPIVIVEGRARKKKRKRERETKCQSFEFKYLFNMVGDTNYFVRLLYSPSLFKIEEGEIFEVTFSFGFQLGQELIDFVYSFTRSLVHSLRPNLYI